MLILSVTAVLACASVIYGGTSGNSGQVDQTYYSYGVQTDGLFSFLWNDLSNDNSAVALENPVYKLAYLVTLPYSFPFYGHQVLNVSVVSSGFLFVGPVLHQYLTANQYIAPLMADFNPTLSANSEIKYVKSDAGSFSFQTTWFTNGSIAFLYETIPMNFTDIQTTNHPVKVGLSNAYNIINDNRMTTYEYNLVDLTDTLIQDRTVIVLHPKPIIMSDDFVWSHIPGLRCSMKWPVRVVSRDPVTVYCKADEAYLRDYAGRSSSLEDVDQSMIGDLSELEMHLLTSQELMKVRGKGNRPVPCILPADVLPALRFISNAAVRETVGIRVTNKFLFPSKGQFCVRSYASLKAVCRDLHLRWPDRITSVNLRKYTATLSQVIDLKENELQWLCNHLGHTSRVHLEHYRQMSGFIERVNISKILLMQDLNLTKDFVGKSLKEIGMIPFKACIRYYNCEACLSANISFTCKWCPAVGRCSDEVDWYRQEWLDAGCESKAVSECSTTITEPTGIPSQSDNTNDTYHEDHVANTVTFSTPPTVVMATPGENNHDSHSHDHGDDVGLNATTNAPVTAVISQDHSGTPRPGASTEGQVTMSIPNVNYIATGDQLDFQIEEIGFRSVTISWLYPLDNVIPMDFVVQMRTAVTSWYNHTQTDVYILDYRYMAKIKPLLESTIYYIRMYAVADFGRSDYSTTIAFTTKGPSSSSEMLTSGAFPVIFSVLFVQIVLLLQRDDMEPI